MPWVLHTADVTNVYWRRTEDGFIVGFNRKGVGEPWSDEATPPAEIDNYAPPIEIRNGDTIESLRAEIDALKARVIPIEADVSTLKRGGRP